MSRIMTVIVLGIFGLSCSSMVSGQELPTINDKDIVVVGHNMMEYPHLARVGRVQGLVVVRVGLDDAGKVIAASALSGAPMLIPDTLSNARKWVFRPNSEKTAVIVYEFRFRNDDAKCRPTQSKSRFLFKEPNFVSVTSCPFMLQPQAIK